MLCYFLELVALSAINSADNASRCTGTLKVFCIFSLYFESNFTFSNELPNSSVNLWNISVVSTLRQRISLIVSRID